MTTAADLQAGDIVQSPAECGWGPVRLLGRNEDEWRCAELHPRNLPRDVAGLLALSDVLTDEWTVTRDGVKVWPVQEVQA